MKTKAKCWYFVVVSECVLCGRGDSYRERRHGKRPANPNKRHKYTQMACGEHFA